MTKPVTDSQFEQLFSKDENDFVTFEVTIDVTEDEEEPYKVTLTGEASVSDRGRFINFDPLGDADTVVGMLQREYAKSQKLFIVDKVKIDRLRSEYAEANPEKIKS